MHGKSELKEVRQMQHITIDRIHGYGRVAGIECVSNGSLEKIDIKGKCFLLIALCSGKLGFKVGGTQFCAASPAFVCFDETENPELTYSSGAKYICIYFHPEFLNVNMTFDFFRQSNYDGIAAVYDLFLMKPFVDKAYVVHLERSQVERIRHTAECMRQELEIQRDWYWTCRARSYLLEIIIILERMYVPCGCGDISGGAFPALKHKLQDVVLYIEGHFDESITLQDIVRNTGINHTSLTAMMKKEFGCTAIEYLMRYRITVAKKQLEFTDVPIKDIAYRTGFKTVQHFGRIFLKYTGETPAAYRKNSVDKRKEALG